MSLILDDLDHEQKVEALLEMILSQLILLNDRIEDTFNTGIEEED